MHDNAHIAVVEDDPDIAAMVATMLQANGYRASTAADGAALRTLLGRSSDIALVVLDLNLPGESGLDICRWLRRTGTLPVIILTARGDPIDRVIGLEIGADDYLAKPFEPRELLARIRSVLRRTAAIPLGEPPMAEDAQEVRFGAWRLDHRRRHLIDANDTVVALSGSEYRLLATLIAHRGEVLPREVLHRLTGGADDVALDRSIDLRVSRLRAKLGDDLDGSPIIKTVRGRGYVFSEAVTPC
ncbi:response regulator [Novosphingobium sp. Leaf2]|uniref:response regulator n=1 Tax=Novosphingobium sp. Leaf2 TaxID=1735670 RepID=UPI0006F8BE34|nr:response regulator transcription factor [Novosphingobium sp. Leaf2]KQM18455.1 two-component system response regulator [Novosphingobium sp. Leaf2]